MGVLLHWELSEHVFVCRTFNKVEKNRKLFFEKETTMREKIKSFMLLTGAILCTAVGVYFFKFSNNFTFGGITGLAVLVAKTGVMSAGDFTMIANMVLLAIGFIVFGKKFGIKTTYCSVLLSVTLSALERLYPMTHPLTDQPMLELCFAIALPAFGSALLFNAGSSSGGTDIIAMIFKKFTSLNIGKALFVSDLVITIAGCFVFDIKTGLFSFLGLGVRSLVIDTAIESLNLSKYFNVVCERPKPICDYITQQLGKSATYCEARGAFSGKQKYVIFSAMNRMQAMKLRNFIKLEDPSAFILISNTSEIIGKGFHTV